MIETVSYIFLVSDGQNLFQCILKGPLLIFAHSHSRNIFDRDGLWIICHRQKLQRVDTATNIVFRFFSKLDQRSSICLKFDKKIKFGFLVPLTKKINFKKLPQLYSFYRLLLISQLALICRCR